MGELTPPQLAEVEKHLRQGAKIEAIKVYRAHAQCDLSTAKEAVDAVHDRLRADQPEGALKPSGCFSLLIVGVGLLGVGIWATTALV